jgi:hypothetical protein
MKPFTTLRLLPLCFALLITACAATGPKFNTVENSFAVLSPGKARVFFYRVASEGAAIRPEIRLNGVVVGKAEPRGAFFKDVEPGNIEIATASEVEKKLTFTVEPGETRYVRFAMGFGLVVGRVIPQLVSEAEAKKEMAELAYTGASSNESQR